jgi:HK97 family phage major capsid protein
MTKLEMLKSLIEKTDDKEELRKLNEELIEAIREEEKAKMAVKAAEDKMAETVAKAREASEMAKVPDQRIDVIKVGTPELYKGYNLKAAIGTFQDDGRVHSAIRSKARKDPAAAELVCKWMVDVMARSRKGPATPDMIKGMNETTSTAGGLLTPTEERMAVLSYIRDMSIAMTDCAHIPMNSDSVTMSRENAKVSVAYTDEASDATETTPSLAPITLTANRLDAYTDVTNELINDNQTPGGIAGLLAGQFIEAIGQKIDSTVFLGTGSPVSGVFLSTGYSEVFSTGSSHFSELLESNIRNVVSKLQPNRRGNAKWYMSASVLWQYFYGLQNTNGDPMFLETHGGANAPYMFYGKPVREGNDSIMPSSSAASTGMAVFGDLAGFLIGDRLTNVVLMEDPYSLSTSYQTRFLMFTRWAFAHALNQYYARIVTAA